MRVLISEKLSEHKYKTPEGYLICTDAILARTGKQQYRRSELFVDGNDEIVDVDRPYEQVFDKKTLASFENKPVTIEHPSENVNVDNFKDYAVGYVRDVKQGKYNDEDVIIGNLVITDRAAIEKIENGEMTDLSCGYDCDIIDSNGSYVQNNIRGNHVALCEEGRAGIARIVDSNADFHKYVIEYEYIKTSSRIDEEPELVKTSKTINAINLDEALKQIPDNVRIIQIKKDGVLYQSFKKKFNRIGGGCGNKQEVKLDNKMEDAMYTYKLTKKRNDYDEYIVQAYKNGKKYEDATYYSDDWDDALGTLKAIAKREGLNFRQQGSIYIADSKIKDSKLDMLDALKLVKLIEKIK